MRKRNSSKKAIALMVSIVLVVTVAVGATLAYLIDVKGPLNNKFTPSAVTVEVNETFDGNTKSNVSIKNTGDTAAYIRAAVIVTWQNAAGEVYGQAPVEGDDYTISFNTGTGKDKWSKNGDFYYWKQPVDPGKNTGILIKNAVPVAGRAPEGYYLCIEIIASGVQSVGTDGTKSAVVDAWGIDPSTLS